VQNSSIGWFWKKATVCGKKKKRQKLNKDTAKRTEKPFSLSYTTLHAIKH